MSKISIFKVGMPLPKEGKYLYLASPDEELDYIFELDLLVNPPTSIIPTYNLGDPGYTSEMAGLMKAQYPGKVGIVAAGRTIAERVALSESAQRLGYSPIIFLPAKNPPRGWVAGALHFNLVLRDDLWYHAPEIWRDEFVYHHMPGFWTTGDWV